MDKTRQRSRKGCITCRQKRKKCDELKPRCTRCIQGGDQCIWPEASARNRDTNQSRYRTSPQGSLVSGHFQACAADPTYADVSVSPGISDTSLDAFMESLPHIESADIYASSATASGFEHNAMPPSGTVFKSNGMLPPLASVVAPDTSWQLVSLEPKTYLPPTDSRQLSAWKSVASKPFSYRDLDQDDEDEEYETRPWLPEARRSLRLVIHGIDQPHLLEICDSWILFLTRYSFDPARVVDIAGSIFQRYLVSDSIRHGMLSTAALIQGYYDPRTPPAIMFKRAQNFASIAERLTHLDMQRPEISLETKLAGLSELMCYNYYSGNFNKYYKYLQLSAPIVSILIGSNIEFHKLRGVDTFDIRFFVWCDVLASVALSRPTLATYVCDVEPLLQDNLQGRDTTIGDAGLEWIVGCPDAFTMLMIQIVNLRHSQLPQSEKTARATRIEEVARAWVIRPSRVSNSLLRIERMATQEVWRHAVILFLYHAIHKAAPINEVVQKSVKQIIDLASTMRPGRNPDCLLPVPYFIAATFATTPKDRHLLRTRVAGVGSEAFVDGLVQTLDRLWKEAGDPRKCVDWSKKQPPEFAF